MSITLALTIIIGLLGLIAVLLGAWVLYQFQKGIHDRLAAMEHQVQQVEADRKAREQVLRDARGRQRSHWGYSDSAALEHSSLLLVDAALEAEALKARLETALSINQALRSGPNKYNPNQSEATSRTCKE